MSVVTKRGDAGETDLLYGRRVPKDHPRIVANGAIDELNAVLGIVRVHARHEERSQLDEHLGERQQQLFALMGEIATLTEDRARYEADGFRMLSQEETDDLTKATLQIESDLNARFKDWAVPGASASLASAHLDHARTLCRRAERAVHTIAEPTLALPATFLNRLSDYLWLQARAAERA